jgi:2-C-methyl-D-erythritol 2,4-cyclodiphosphate synthase
MQLPSIRREIEHPLHIATHMQLKLLPNISCKPIMFTIVPHMTFNQPNFRCSKPLPPYSRRCPACAVFKNLTLSKKISELEQRRQWWPFALLAEGGKSIISPRNRRRYACFTLWRGISVLDMRVGIGHDSHRLEAGGPLRLGGIDVPHDKHAVGHSDADVLLHAITDALLGAAALGDIGEMFPDTDEANRGRDSAQMLSQAMGRVVAAGHDIVNLDCIIFAQKPKLGPHKAIIRNRIAEVLGLAVERIGLKAKTGEGTGEIGREELISAQCVALLQLTTDN